MAPPAPGIVVPEPTAAAASRVSRRRRVARWLAVHGGQVRHGVVAAVALGCPTAAVYSWHTWAGLVATGLAVLLTDLAVGVPDQPRRQP
jgi:hypothetical protein